MPQQHSVTLPLVVGPPAGDPALTLIGGWRVKQWYCKGGLAIDFAMMRAWTLGHAQTVPLAGYDLPAMGSGTNPNSWPQVNQARNYGSPYSVSGWNSGYGEQLYAAGLMWRDNKLWMSGRGFYASGGSYPSTVVKKFAVSGSTATLSETLTYAGRPMQAFGGGFVKGAASYLIGNGGYESGQGARSGPCWMDAAGGVANEFPDFGAAKTDREKRANDYSCSASAWFVPPDGPTGYWFAGRIWGGGLVLGGKACFFVDQGTGPVAYSNQTDTFGYTSRTYLYRYGANQHFGTYAAFPTPRDKPVIGSEINPAGDRAYLLVRDGWSDNGGYDPSPLLCCYSVG